MALTPRSRDAVDRIINQGERLKFQELRRQPGGAGVHTVSHTWVIGGDFDVDIVSLPPMVAAVDTYAYNFLDVAVVERQFVVGFSAGFRAGTSSISVSLKVAGTTVATQSATPHTGGSAGWQAFEAVEVFDGDFIWPIINSVSSSDAVDFYAAVAILVVPPAASPL